MNPKAEAKKDSKFHKPVVLVGDGGLAKDPLIISRIGGSF
jgi:hypothetical protein